ncbi:hypothetical protein SmJEL517_g04011 [Synchytrium microbalum]|uniref:Lysophospholipase NTE1 n=1 Tax=Synchytrium microbalum TaxID=1806994 RepID=A0A507BZV0_9FUNG|nr:uncharacterized protein SmJEL517_g04011 [Synchytrium microbalum]TPX32972.1 hypothetical protein SmJEL517_g04011 [Synchytrium microbalum]
MAEHVVIDFLLPTELPLSPADQMPIVAADPIVQETVASCSFFCVLGHVFSTLYTIILWTIRLPYSIFNVSVKTITIVIDYQTIFITILFISIVMYLLFRYRILTRYSRLPVAPISKKGVPFDLHPDAALEDSKDLPPGYADEFLGAFLSSIKVFGYLDRPVFHELAQGLQTRKLREGDILFKGDEDDSRDFYVVVDGCVQIFVKGQDQPDQGMMEGTVYEVDDDQSGLEGHHLLNEVHSGETVSSLFNILAVLTEDKDVEDQVADDNAEEGLSGGGGHAKQTVFPGLSTAIPTSDATFSPPLTPAGVDLDDIMSAGSTAAGRKSFSAHGAGVDTDETGSSGFGTGRKPSPSTPLPSTSFHRYRAISANIVARAACDTTLAVIPAASFSKLSEKFPKSAAHIAQVILTRFQRVTFLTLYRYLGLSRELLHIERTVNEYQGYTNGLPQDFPHSAMDRLRLRQAVRAEESTDSETTHRPKSTMLRKPSTTTRPVTPTPSRVTRFADSALAYDADNDSSSLPPPSILPTPKISNKSNTPGLLGNEGVRLAPEVDAADSIELKRAVFDCIAFLIGLKYDAATHSAPTSASTTKSSRHPTFFVGSEHHPLHSRNESLPNVLPHIRLPHNREESISSRDGVDSDNDSVTSSTSSSNVSHQQHTQPQPDPYLDVQIIGYERGQNIVNAGDKVLGLYFVADGVVEASMVVDPDRALDMSALGGTSGSEKERGRERQRSPRHSGASRDGDDGGGTGSSKKSRRSLFLIRPGGLAGYISAITGHISLVSLRAKTDCHLGFISKAVLDRYVERNPSILLTLAKRLLAQLSPVVLYVDLALEWSVVNAGQKVCRQNERAESIFIVLNGRLRAIAERHPPLSASSPDTPSSSHSNSPRTPSPDPHAMGHEFEILGEYGQGESIGEFEVLTGARRPATIHAIRDTEIAVMPKTLFNALAIRHPEITVQISRIIAERSLALAKRRNDPVPMYMTGGGVDFGKNNSNLKTVAILPVSGSVPIMDFADKLRDAFELVGASVAMLNTSSIMSALGKHAFSRMGRLKLMGWLADQEEHHRLVLYVADGGVNSPWTQRCVRQADCILLVGLGDEDPSIGEYERLLMGMKTTARKELVLVHSERHCAPGSTAAWLKNRLWIHAHHHMQMQLFPNPRMLTAESRKTTLANIRTTFQRYYTRASGVHLHRQGSDPHLFSGLRSDFARLARRLLSKSIGIAFGGGGARGIAHVGIVRAFEEAGIPVDMVGGTSIGSFVGGLYARENDHVSIYGRAKNFAGRMASVWRQLLDLTYPVTSLFTGHEFNRGIWKCFLDTHIEDCWLSYFCVTTNITWSRMEVHRTGYMWRYIRASMSLAGFLPPLCDNGDMLLDGGYLNNLPADIIRALGANTIVAIDVGGAFDNLPATYGDSLSGWWALLAPFIPFVKHGKIAAQAEIQSRLTYVASVKQLDDVKNSPDVLYLHPPVAVYGVLQFEKFKEIYDAGYEYGKMVVSKWQEDGILEERFGVRVNHGRAKRVRRASI